MTVTDVNQLVNRFEQAAKMMKTVASGGDAADPRHGSDPGGGGYGGGKRQAAQGQEGAVAVGQPGEARRRERGDRLGRARPARRRAGRLGLRPGRRRRQGRHRARKSSRPCRSSSAASPGAVVQEKRFPERQRCRKCAQKLGGPGTGVPGAVLHAAVRRHGRARARCSRTLPGECKTERGGRWEFKRRYRSSSRSGQAPRRPVDELVHLQHCGHLHIGHSRIDLATETHRVLGDRAALVDFLVKSRGNATHKQIAEVAKIRPIRLKELEDPTSEKVDLNAFFAVLAVYGSSSSRAPRGAVEAPSPLTGANAGVRCVARAESARVRSVARA